MARRKQAVTPSQTVGPFFAYGMTPQQYNYPLPDLISNTTSCDQAGDDAITITGRVFDGEGMAVDDAMVEIWQADQDGTLPRRFSNTGFTGIARSGTGVEPQGRYIFHTVKPGSIGENRAPHILFVVFARGMLNHQYTLMYFDDEAAANHRDPVFNQVPASRRRTLLAKQHGIHYCFDIHLQGAQETVFFDI